MSPLASYAVIGDCRSAALVSNDGAIDWLCWPRFDSPSIFGALLDERAGSWRIAPAGRSHVERRYVDGTNVLETVFRTASGVLRLTDLMPVTSEEEKRALFFPDHQILRQLECESGEVEVEMRYDPRPGYALRPVRLRPAGKLGIRLETGGGLLLLRTDIPLEPGAAGALRGRARLRAGEVLHASLTFDDEWTAVIPPLGAPARAAISRSVRWWRDWSSQLTYDGPCAAAVLRSALTLKLLDYAPSGAIVAAPTTSLPERIGGELNWDYRFCWLRDAALTMRALFGLGFADEAQAFLSWLVHSTRLTRPELRILYDVHGERPPRERILDHLRGYRDSRPVRVGNAAADQLQLDVYGEVIDAAAQFVRQGGALDRETGRLLRGLGEYVCGIWRTADEGIWEPRSGRAHHTHSRLLCWTALDRLLELHAKGHLDGTPVDRFRRERALIRKEIEERAWNAALGSYVARLDGDALDASLLLLAWYGFEDPSSERMQRTWARIRERLGAGEALLYRYRTGESPGEGAFGICSFWAAEFLALGGGELDEARDFFERLVALGNDVGLFAEELAPGSGEPLGNFPQAFTHVGLINAAMTLARREAVGAQRREHG
jgi:GH15 family glucan-1,4-alpha-glucosidase